MGLLQVFGSRGAELVDDQALAVSALGVGGLAGLFVDEGRGREHLRGKGAVAAEVRQQAPEGGIGDARHGGEEERRGDGLALAKSIGLVP